MSTRTHQGQVYRGNKTLQPSTGDCLPVGNLAPIKILLFRRYESEEENHCIWLFFLVKPRQMDPGMNQITQAPQKPIYYYYAQQDVFDIQGGVCFSEPVHSIMRSWASERKRQGWIIFCFFSWNSMTPKDSTYLLSPPNCFLFHFVCSVVSSLTVFSLLSFLLSLCPSLSHLYEMHTTHSTSYLPVFSLVCPWAPQRLL